MTPTYQALFTALQYHQQGQSAPAEALCRQVLEVEPENTDALGLLAVACQAQARLDEAITVFQRALQVKPDLVDVLNNLGYALRIKGDFESAAAHLEQALRLKPDFAHAHVNLGLVLKQQGKLDDAIERYHRALELMPDFAEAHVSLGIALLLQGNFEEGWPEYEWRWKRSDFGIRPANQPLWDGSPLDGKTILLYAEQGLGDTLQFIRFAPAVKARGGKVIVQCQESLVELIRGCPGADIVVAKDAALPAFHVCASLLSLPAILRITLADLPAATGYVNIEDQRIEKWRAALAGPKLKIGIAWQGNPKHQADHHRSFPLDCFALLAEMEGIQLYSLQKGAGSEQVEGWAGRLPMIDLAAKMPDDFRETAAAVKNLDLVITADTALAHLAGALAVPVWVALPRSPDWRWLLNRDDSPWYPTMRLFRQRRLGDWREVFDRIAAAVRVFRIRSSP